MQTTKLILLPTCSAITAGTTTNRTEKGGLGLAETSHAFLKVFQPEHETLCLKHVAQKKSTTDDTDRGSTVVKVLCYKSEGRWFDPSWCQWIFH